MGEWGHDGTGDAVPGPKAKAALPALAKGLEAAPERLRPGLEHTVRAIRDE